MNAALEALMNGGKASPLNLDPYARAQPQPDAATRYQPPYAQSNYSTSNYSANPYASYEPDPTTAAAAAFDALAQGLAASSRPEPRHTYDYQQQAAPTPSHTALVAQPLLPVVQEYHPQAIRTLEDSVAEMLKPMLQRWLSDNMPRIIERALRFEAASGMKPPNSQ
jgi:cell pole-organizing protein PopZ